MKNRQRQKQLRLKLADALTVFSLFFGTSQRICNLAAAHFCFCRWGNNKCTNTVILHTYSEGERPRSQTFVSLQDAGWSCLLILDISRIRGTEEVNPVLR